MSKGDSTRRKFSLFPKKLGEPVEQITSKLCSKRGFPMPTLVKFWPEIVGEAYGKQTMPIHFFQDTRTGNGSLTIRAPSALSTEIKHMEPQILERISLYLGYRGVHRIIIEHALL